MFNLKNSLRTADTKARPTETNLRKDDIAIPNSITENQLDSGGYYFETEKVTDNLTEKNLESVRGEEVNQLPETRLNNAKGGFHQHRNSKASAGDINKVEEQRLAREDRQEKEKQEPSSVTPKDSRLFDRKPGKDGIKLQSNNFPIRVGQSNWDATVQLFNRPGKEADPEELWERVRQQEADLAQLDQPFPIEERTGTVPPNPEGPAVMRAFQDTHDIPVGVSTSTGTKVEERALLYRKSQFNWVVDQEQLNDQALRFLHRKYPDSHVELIEDHEGDDSDPEVGTIRYTLVDQVV